jgi:hypothetical protein
MSKWSVACVVLALAALVVATPLDDYVNKPDPNYSWSDTGVVVKSGLGWTGMYSCSCIFLAQPHHMSVLCF